jgi:carbohydrate-binding DOMON domain-containing protein
MQQAPSTNTQTETRTEKTERIVEREPGKFLGVDATVAMLVGAALLIVIVFALVAMSRRRDEIQHTHTRV